MSNQRETSVLTRPASEPFSATNLQSLSIPGFPKETTQESSYLIAKSKKRGPWKLNLPHKSVPEDDVKASDKTFITRADKNDDFIVKDWLRPTVNHWEKIFATYGDKQVVLFNTENPSIIYKVLDFQLQANSLSEKNYKKEKIQVRDHEMNLIRGSLRYLGEGNAPRNVFENELAATFSAKGINSPEAFKRAAEKNAMGAQTGRKEKYFEGLVECHRYYETMKYIFTEERIKKGLPPLPPQLVLLPAIETGFADLRSEAKAQGPWQFLAADGKACGLIIKKNEIDQRKDFIESTRAAAIYLNDAYQKLESWPVAVTSYIYGRPGMAKAVNEVKSNSLFDIIKRFAGKSFGSRSKNYYAELLAANEIFENPQKFTPDLKIKRRFIFDEIKLNKDENISNLLNAANLTKENFSALNPALLQKVLDGKAKIPSGFIIKLPPGSGESFIEKFRQGTLLDRIR